MLYVSIAIFAKTVLVSMHRVMWFPDKTMLGNEDGKKNAALHYGSYNICSVHYTIDKTF